MFARPPNMKIACLWPPRPHIVYIVFQTIMCVCVCVWMLGCSKTSSRASGVYILGTAAASAYACERNYCTGCHHLQYTVF